MKDYQQRVVDERSELWDRIQKLTKFILTEASRHISIEERNRLILQQGIMYSYAEVLKQRIEAFQP